MVVTTPASEFGPLLDEALALEFEGKSEEERREGISDADLDLVRKLLLASAQRALETQQFEDYCREGDDFGEDHQVALTEFWRVQRDHILDLVHGASVFNNRLQQMSWRIDTKTKTRHVEEMNELTTVVELVLGSGITASKASQVVRFEMDANQLKSMASQVEMIQDRIESLGGQ
jgi:hypothetical protein